MLCVAKRSQSHARISHSSPRPASAGQFAPGSSGNSSAPLMPSASCAPTFPVGPMILRPAADNAISVARRFAWVSCFTALTTYQIAVRRYPGGCSENHAHAALLALNTLA